MQTKNLCFIVCFLALTPHSLKSVEKPLVIVISPLLSLMASQVLDAKQYGIEAAQMPSEEDTVAGSSDLTFVCN